MAYTINIIVDDCNIEEKLNYYIQSIVSTMGAGVKCEIFPDHILSQGFSCIKCNERYKITILTKEAVNGLNDKENSECEENVNGFSKQNIKDEPRAETMAEMVRLPKLMTIGEVFNGRDAEDMIKKSSKVTDFEMELNAADVLDESKDKSGTRKKRIVARICNGCNKIFNSFRTHNEHVCSEFDFLQCKHCDAGFYHDNDLNEHLETEHKDKEVFECTICDTKFINQYVLKTHLGSKRHLSKANALGVNVSEETAQLEAYRLNKNEKKIKLVGNITKIIDDSQFPPTDLTCKDVKPVVAPVKKKKTTTKLQAKFIKLNKMKEKRGRQCKTCNKKCFFRRTRLEHRCYFTDLRQWQCEYCEKLFPEEIRFFRHLMLHHRIHTGFCEVCNKKFYSPNGFEAHLKTQKHKRLSEQQFLCECQQGDSNVQCSCDFGSDEHAELPLEVSLAEDGHSEEEEDDVQEILST